MMNYSDKYYDANYEYRHVTISLETFVERAPLDYQDFYKP